MPFTNGGNWTIPGSSDLSEWKFGSVGFIDSIRNLLCSEPRSKEVPRAVVLSVNPDAVIEAVCQSYRISENRLLTSRRGVTNLPRDLAMYTLRMYSRKTLAEIGRDFGVSNYSTVSSAIDRAKKVLKSDVKVRKSFKKICAKLQKSQRET